MSIAAIGGKGGHVGLVRQPDRISYDPVRGASRWVVWRALDDALINQQVAIAQSMLLPYNVSSTGTTHTIEIEIIGGSNVNSVVNPGDAVSPTDRWEMPPNELQKTIWEHKNLATIAADVLALAQNYVSNGSAIADFSADDSNPLVGLSSTEASDLAAAYRLAQRGATHFPFGQYVLRHISNAPAFYQANVADVNVEKLYTTAQLLAEASNPLLWAMILPAAYVYRIQHIAAPPTRSDYLWSWRKLPSGMATAAGGRIEIATEYWLEQWSTFLYDVVT